MPFVRATGVSRIAAVLAAIAFFGAGCESGGDYDRRTDRRGEGEATTYDPGAGASKAPEDGAGNSAAGKSAFAGVWALYEGSQIKGSPYWYLHARDDRSFFIANHKDGSQVRVSGTYTESNGRLTGPFTNPGTGTGRIEARLDGGLIRLEFIEYWHTPHKVIPFVGQR